MPVWKYRSLEEAERALWKFDPGPEYYEQLDLLWEFAEKLNPVRYPRGIFKFKSIEEANKHMDELILKHALEKQEELKRVEPDEDE